MRADTGDRPLSTARGLERLSRLPIFTAKDYLVANPDVAQAGVDAVEHAFTHGAREDRTLFADTALARAYGQAAQRSRPAEPSKPPAHDESKDGRRCTVFVHSLSDDAYRETARGFVADLIALGLDATMSDERVDPSADHGTAVFVAPHDFFSLGLGPIWADPGILGEGLVMIDDPAESIEGGRSIAPLLEAGGVIDLSPIGAAIWSEAGIPTVHFQPRVRMRNRWLDDGDLGHPLMLAAPEQARRPGCDPLDWHERPLDLLFFARESPRRNAALGHLAPSLAPHRCFIYAQQGVASKTEERLHRAHHWRISGHLSTQARLTLHLNEGRFPALERRRIVVQAMAGGSAVVSTARFAEPGLEPGLHYFQDDLKHLGGLIDWLIVDPDGRRAAEGARERAFDRVASTNRDRGRLAGLRALLGRVTSRENAP